MKHKNLQSIRRSHELSDELVRGKFRSIVCGDGLDIFLVGQQKMSDGFCQRLGLLPMSKFGHEEQVGGALHNGKYGPQSNPSRNLLTVFHLPLWGVDAYWSCRRSEKPCIWVCACTLSLWRVWLAVFYMVAIHLKGWLWKYWVLFLYC